MGTHQNHDKFVRVLSLCHCCIQTKKFCIHTHRVWFKCAMTVTETQGCRGGLALAGSAYKAGRTVPTRECLPKLSARNHRHRCFRLLNLFVNIDGVKRIPAQVDWCGLRIYYQKVGISYLRTSAQSLEYQWSTLEDNPLSLQKPRETMHSLPLLPFAVLILVQTNPSQGLFWRPAA